MRIHTFSLLQYGLSAGLLLAFSGPVPGAPGDWSQWRGPDHNDISTETGLLKDWPAGGPPLVWKATGLNVGYSEVSIDGDLIYATGDRGDSSQLHALNRADGKPVWSVRLGRAGAPGDERWIGPRSMPVVDGDMLYVFGQWGELVCFEKASGKEVWRKDCVKDLSGAIPHYGYCESPLIDGQKVLVTAGGEQGSVVALDKKTGALLWRSKGYTDLPHYSSLLPVEMGGVRQYVQFTAQGVAGVGAADGKLLWHASREGQRPAISPICSDGLVYVSNGYGLGCNLYKVAGQGGAFTITQVYANKVMVNHHGGVIKVGGCLYGYSDGKGWTCQDFKTGEAKWSENQKASKGSLVCADGMLLLPRAEERAGTVVLIEANPAGFKEHGRFDQPGRSQRNSWAHPVVAGGRLYLRDQDLLLCYDVKAK